MSSEPTPDAIHSMTKQGTVKGNRRNGNRTPIKMKFEGEIPEMKAHVYDCVPNRQADQYVKTTRVLANYFVNNHRNSGHFRNAILNLALPEIPPVPRPVASPGGILDEFDRLEYIEAIKQRNKDLKEVEHLNMQLYTAIWSQCSNTMRERIENLSSYEDFNSRSDGIALLQAIKSASYNYIETTYKIDSINEAAINLLNCRQANFMTPQEYFELFKIRREVYEQVGGNTEASIGALAIVAGEEGVDITHLSTQHRANARELELAALFIRNSDKGQYSGLQASLKNDFLSGNNNNPRTLVEAYGRLVHWKETNICIPNGNANDGVAFTTNGNISRNNEREDEPGVTFKKNIMSNNRGKKNGYARKDDESKAKANNNKDTKNQISIYPTISLNMPSPNIYNVDSHNFNTSSEIIPRTWILLDNQSTVDVFCEKSLLQDIYTSKDAMSIQCNAGTIVTNQKGTFHNYGEVWFCKNGIANILSFANARNRGCNVAYDTYYNTFTLQQPNGTEITFSQSPNGLYYHDANMKSVMLINTVESNKTKYSNRDYFRAKAARDLLQIIGHPSIQQFLEILDNNQLPNCPVTRRDAIMAEDIFGPDLGSLKGKTVNRPPEPVQIPSNDLPLNIMQQYCDVTLCGDIMFVNKIPFFVTISRHIHFGTVEMIANRQMGTILNGIKAVTQIYQQRGFNISNILLDGEFEPLRGSLATMGIQLNVATNNEHVPEVERYICTIKERVRCIYNTLPFQEMAPRLIIEMVKASNFWLNGFPKCNGISNVLSPRQIVTGSAIEYNRHCTLAFGTYVQTHEAHDNTMIPRTTGALALRPTGNIQGGHYFYSLSSGRLISRNRWTELPMPAEVIERIHTLARRANAASGPLAFYNRYGLPLDIEDRNVNLEPDGNIENETDDDESYHPPETQRNNTVNNDANDSDDDIGPPDAENAYDIDPNLLYHDNIPPPVNYNNNADNAVQEIDIPGVQRKNINNNNHDDSPQSNRNDIDDESEASSQDHVTNDTQQDDNHDNMTLDAAMDAAYGTRTNVYNLRPRQPRNYDHLFTQYSVKKGLQIFGQAGNNAIIKELQQLHNLKVITPVDASSLSSEDKSGALQYLMFLKQKRCGAIKGRGCADGRKQRTYLSKEDTSSPTVAIESVFLSCVIDANENRDIATVDIPGAFLHADMNDVVYMRVDGEMALMLVNIAPDLYQQYIINTKHGNPVLYLCLQKALYGTLQAALLFWEKLSGILLSWDFVLNPYDRCVANKEINGSTCTILWHVDDLKISHVDPEVVSDIIKQLSDEFGTVAPLTIHRGKTHDYLGMQLDFSTPSKVRITMIDYINKILMDCPTDMNGTSPTPAANHLFMVNTSNPKLLNSSDAELFHHIVAQLLFLCKRARPDIQTAISFLCTRVQNPDTDDYKKLSRVIKYLRNTSSLSLTLEASDTKLMQWWVDASYGTHHDMRSHTGGVFTLGKGAIYATSMRQKLNTKSSTEAELVGVNDVLPQALWTKYFLKEQGYGCDEAIIYQDNRSAMLLENNGRASSSKRTRHINIRYYFVADKVKNKEVRIEYCPTDTMIADYFTKPLQGQKFIAFRNFILNTNQPDITFCNVALIPVSHPSTDGCFLSPFTTTGVC